MSLFQYGLDTLFMAPFILVIQRKAKFGKVNQFFTFQPKFYQP